MKHFVRVDLKSAVQINVSFVTVISEPLMEGALNSSVLTSSTIMYKVQNFTPHNGFKVTCDLRI